MLVLRLGVGSESDTVKVLAIVAAALVIVAGLSSVWLSRPVFEGGLDESAFNTMAIAPRDQAITLAMTNVGAVLLVTDADAEAVTAIDLSAATGRSFEDAIEAYVLVTALGLRAFEGAATAARYPWSSLALPLAPRYPNIAAGTNYRAHAEEVGREEGPFLFPKLSSPTRHADMTWAQRLKRVFNIDIEVCSRCGGSVRVIACIEDQDVIDRILAHLRETEKEAPARPLLVPPTRAPTATLSLCAETEFHQQGRH